MDQTRPTSPDDRKRRWRRVLQFLTVGAIAAGGFGLVGAFDAPAAQAQDLIEYALMHALIGLF